METVNPKLTFYLVAERRGKKELWRKRLTDVSMQIPHQDIPIGNLLRGLIDDRIDVLFSAKIKDKRGVMLCSDGQESYIDFVKDIKRKKVGVKNGIKDS